MKLLEIFFIGISLSMDALAVSICKGLSINKELIKKAITIAIYFGFFQALMPIVGYFLGTTFANKIATISPWCTFILLVLIGGNMIKECLDNEDKSQDDRVDFKTMTLLALVTSIDALVVGISFAFLRVNILFATSIVGLITFLICLVGVLIGNRVGNKLGNKANILGGLILIFIGTKILLEYLNIF